MMLQADEVRRGKWLRRPVKATYRVSCYTGNVVESESAGALLVRITASRNTRRIGAIPRRMHFFVPLDQSPIRAGLMFKS